jgi:glycosyltransferase involved in cell wall biosynthesis
MKKLLTIIIPTRNRKNMLEFCLKSVEKYAKFAEIIIVSNGDSLENDVPLKYLNSKDLIIVRSKSRLPMALNWFYGFKFVKTKWVIYLGDDDLMIIEPKILQKTLAECLLDAILFKTQTFNWSDFQSIESLIQEKGIYTCITKSKELNRTLVPNRKKLWIFENLRNIPSGSLSIMSTKYLKVLEDKGFLFSGISPDWNTAAHFLYSQKSYLYVSEEIVYVGKSLISSVEIQRSPNSPLAKEELRLLEQAKLHSRIHNFSFNCPTTWLSRVDSILYAREHAELSTRINDDFLAISALLTTPRYVKKMYHYIKPSVRTKVPLKLLYLIMLWFSIFKYFQNGILLFIKKLAIKAKKVLAIQ